MRRLAAAWRAGSALVSRFLATPSWRTTKFVADRVLLVAALAAIGWATVNGVYTAQRAATNRALALVHIGSAPTVKPPEGEHKASVNVPPTVVLEGTRSAQLSIAITNDGEDGVSVKGGTLTGPYIAGDAELRPSGRAGYIGGHSTSALLGTVTVNCTAAASVSHALVMGYRVFLQEPTTLTVSVKDTNGVTHSVALPIDNTAFAVQGRVCTS